MYVIKSSLTPLTFYTKELSMKKIRLLASITLFLMASCASGLELYNPKTGHSSSLKEGVSELPSRAIYLLGETHYQAAIQKAQGQFIREVVLGKSLENDFTVAWEFLDFPKQEEIENTFKDWTDNQISTHDFFKGILGGSPGQHLLYAPMFEVAKSLGGDILATNAPRAWKSKIVKDGFSALSSSEIPRNLVRGSDAYFDRFVLAVGGHGSPDQIENYFLAQSYTDAVMADQIDQARVKSATFMIVGHFHTDYFHGLPKYLGALNGERVVNIRMIDASSLSEQELAKELRAHPQYGHKADYFLILNR